MFPLNMRNFNFNPRTPHGVRQGVLVSPAAICHFNPRTPHGVRQERGNNLELMEKISIHAPLTGCDLMVVISCLFIVPFQSTHPSRGATMAAARSMPCRIFQSTHPSRGATYSKLNIYQGFLISIHAPLTGCDADWFNVSGVAADFNPRTPHGVRQTSKPATTTTTISIHAPLTGCDVCFQQLYCSVGHFNPRTPHGVRRKGQPLARLYLQFQSTHPSRGATLWRRMFI